MRGSYLVVCSVVFLLSILNANLCAWDTRQIESQALRQDWQGVIKQGEKDLAGYVDEKPPWELLYWLAIAYLNTGNTYRVEDICDILLKEYNLSEPARSSVAKLRAIASNVPQQQVVTRSTTRANPVVIQFGAFKDISRAKKLKTRLNALGIPADIEAEGGLYKVRLQAASDLIGTILEKARKGGIDEYRVFSD